MNRFFVDPAVLVDGPILLDGGMAHQMARVLRLRPGDRVVLLDGSGQEVVAELRQVRPHGVVACPVERRPGRPEPACAVTVYQGVLRPARFEWLLEKGTELGVVAFVPLLTERSVVRPEDGGKADRWRRIVREAAEQCGRAVLPEVRPPARLTDAIGGAGGLRLLCWEASEGPGLRMTLREAVAAGARPAAVSLFMGPEGGFTEAEVEAAREAGAHVVSLGRRILRSETAGLAAAAAVLYELGELGG